jgi:hypothetical protein
MIRWYPDWQELCGTCRGMKWYDGKQKWKWLFLGLWVRTSKP